MTLAELTAVLSEVSRKNPELVTDQKVRRYILLVVEEGRKARKATESGRDPIGPPKPGRRVKR